MAEAAACHLGDRYRPGAAVASVMEQDGRWVLNGVENVVTSKVVVATSPQKASRMVDDDLAGTLRRAVTAPVAVVGLGGPVTQFSIPAGFGVLAGPDAGMAVRGVLFESSYAPDRAPPGHHLTKLIAGGATRPEVVGWDDERLSSEVRQDLETMLGMEMQPTFVEIVRHHDGIPQYELGHDAWLSELDTLLAERPGFHLTGWGYRGVGLIHLGAEAAQLARSLSA